MNAAMMAAGAALILIAGVLGAMTLAMAGASSDALPEGPDAVEGVLWGEASGANPVGDDLAWGRVKVHAVVPAHPRDTTVRLLDELRGEPRLTLRTDGGTVSLRFDDPTETFYGFTPERTEVEAPPPGARPAPPAARAIVVEVLGIRPGDRLLVLREGEHAKRVWKGGRQASLARSASHRATGETLSRVARLGALLCLVCGLALVAWSLR